MTNFDFFYKMVPYFVAMLIPIIFFLFYLRGFFTRYLKVRVSRGAKVLVKVHASIYHYYSVGKIEDDQLIYKRADKQEARVSIGTESHACFYRTLGVNAVDTDERTGTLLNPQFVAVEGYDPVKWSNLLVRALNHPSLDDEDEKKKQTWILVICIISAIGLLIVGIIAYKTLVGVHDVQNVCNATIQLAQTAII